MSACDDVRRFQLSKLPFVNLLATFLIQNSYKNFSSSTVRLVITANALVNFEIFSQLP